MTGVKGPLMLIVGAAKDCFKLWWLLPASVSLCTRTAFLALELNYHLLFTFAPLACAALQEGGRAAKTAM